MENEKLYIVPTPIGNLEDITLRAIRILKEVDLILAEDTRTTSVLLKHLDINKPMRSYHIHNEHKSVDNILKKLEEGSSIALVSDAGTPAISDPGFLIVREALNAGYDVECLPGATAFVPALVQSGISNDRFVFEGFLPHKKGRATRLQQLAEEERTIILYESPHRLLKCLEQLIEVMGEERKISVARELTKMFEENVRGSLKEVHHYFTENIIKGEIVMVIEGFQKIKVKKNKYKDK